MQARILTAHAALRLLFETDKCAVCRVKMVSEAVHVCTVCERVVHVRCLLQKDDLFTRSCHLCATGQAPRQDLIVDIMGVCELPTQP